MPKLVKRGRVWHLRGKVRFEDHGRRKSIDVTGTLGTTDENIAKIRAAEIISTVVKGGPNNRLARVRFRRLAKEWPRPKDVTGGWGKRIEGIIHNHLLPFFGAMRAEDVDDHVLEYKAHREAQGTSKGTLLKEFQFLQSIVQQAIPDFRVDRSRMTFKKQPKERGMVLSEDDLWWLIKVNGIVETENSKRRKLGKFGFVIGEGSREFKALAVILFYTGMRFKDVATLNFNAVDWEGKTITLYPWKTRKSSGKKLIMPVHPEVMKVLKTLMKVRRMDGSVFDLDPNYESFLQRFRRSLVGVSLIGMNKHVTPYDLRHSFITNCAEAGVSPYALKDLACHKSITTTERYIHLSGRSVKESMEGVFKTRTKRVQKK